MKNNSFKRGIAPAIPNSWLSEAQESRSWSTTATRQVSAKQGGQKDKSGEVSHMKGLRTQFHNSQDSLPNTRPIGA
jgi:hypothetical protein